MLDDGALIGTRKADFSDIYVEPDPRAYYASLCPLHYQIPQLAAPVIEAVVDAARPAAVLDLCCSYGINAALLRHDLTWERLAEHYERLDDLPTSTLATVDEAFYASRRHDPALRVVGLDSSQPAVGYALRTGVLDAGWAEDLERADASPALAAGLQDVELLISTGGIGYIGEQTIERILRVLPRPEELWLAVFVLRVFDYAAVAELLAGYGLVTERLPGTFRQRRFADRDEREAALHDVVRRGLDPTGLEADGWYHAECFLSRPAAQAAQVPAAELAAAGGGGVSI